MFEKIKNDFLEKHKAQIEKGDYHPLDVDRIRNSTKWVRAFYKHSLDDHHKTVSMIDEVLIWRKKFNANGIHT